MKICGFALAAVLAFCAVSPADAAVLRWDGTADQLDESGNFLGSLSGFFDYDTARGLILGADLEFSAAAGALTPGTGAPLPDFVFDGPGFGDGSAAIFAQSGAGPDFTGSFAVYARSEAGLGVSGGALDLFFIGTCRNAGCDAVDAAGIASSDINYTSSAIQPAAVPVPAGGLMLGAGLAGFAVLGRWRRRRAARA